ncbi:MAG: tetratricopeptide repeat protein [Deltaproteobacteria bacterium]|nr:tetratricopeptide repeat protein [Deltaproteobacteria bacterium]
MNAKAKPQKKKKKHAAKEAREALAREQREKLQVPDPLSRDNLKKVGLRVGIPVLVAWVIAFAIPGWIPKAVVGVLTLVVLGIVGWVWRFASKSKAVAEIVRAADTAEGRKAALEKLDSDFKSGDTAATFAKAQLQMQEDPREALTTLETIRLDKVMAPAADEARSQRAMIHLMLGETDKARVLVDQVDLSRHKDHRIRATLASVVAEGWARTGQARKAVELLDNFDPSDESFADLRPQLYRSLAFAYAWSNQTKKMKQVLRKMKQVNVQLLMGFITKRKNPQGVPSKGIHPVLEKEAFALVMKSGAVPRRTQVKRM